MKVSIPGNKGRSHTPDCRPPGVLVSQGASYKVTGDDRSDAAFTEALKPDEHIQLVQMSDKYCVEIADLLPVHQDLCRALVGQEVTSISVLQLSAACYGAPAHSRTAPHVPLDKIAPFVPLDYRVNVREDGSRPEADEGWGYYFKCNALWRDSLMRRQSGIDGQIFGGPDPFEVVEDRTCFVLHPDDQTMVRSPNNLPHASSLAIDELMKICTKDAVRVYKPGEGTADLFFLFSGKVLKVHPQVYEDLTRDEIGRIRRKILVEWKFNRQS